MSRFSFYVAVMSACLVLLGRAQSDDERVFLTAAHPDSGQVDFIELYEQNSQASELRKRGNWQTLISQLKYPTYTVYDFSHSYLYVCDCDEILQFEIKFFSNQITAVKKGAVANNLNCGGLAIDKFSNLFYVDKNERFGDSKPSQIMKINRDLLQTEKYPAEMFRVMYSGKRAAQSVRDITIEQEYLYWTNDSHSNGYGGVHKAFTEPFITAEPFQTYEIKDISKADEVTTNEHFLFFTGQQSGLSQIRGDNDPELFVQKKQGAGLYYHFNEDMTDKLKRPSSLATYKDTLLLIANEGFISMLDMSKFPPLSQDFKDYTIAVDKPQSGITSNSACTVGAPATKSARGLSLISENWHSVHARTLSASGTVSLGASLASLGLALSLALI